MFVAAGTRGRRSNSLQRLRGGVVCGLDAGIAGNDHAILDRVARDQRLTESNHRGRIMPLYGGRLGTDRCELTHGRWSESA
jgi:hypothetical protein